MLKIELELLSDFAPGTGSGDAGGVDRDVDHTPLGLPIIRARRLKGCLKEAALEVSEAVAQLRLADNSSSELVRLKQVATEQNIEALFGKPGQSNAGWLRLGDARLSQAEGLESWLEWARDLKKTPGSRPSDENAQGAILNAEAVLNHFCGIRSQTTISRVNGGPLPNTLRTSRVIKTGSKFVAEVALVKSPNGEDNSTTNHKEQELLELLQIACNALRRMGLSRNRGWGEIRAEMIKGEGSEEASSLTTTTALPAEVVKTLQPGETYEMRYQLTLRDEVIFSTSAGDPNLLISEGYIPGSTICGAVANQFIEKLNLTQEPHKNSRFRYWFLAGGLRFLNAFPLGSTTPGVRLIPFPHSILREKKSNDRLHDLSSYYIKRVPTAKSGLWRPDNQTLKKEQGFVERATFTTLTTYLPRFELNYHTTRNKAEGRFRGRAGEGAGGVFVYMPLARGQQFEGSILGTKEDLETLAGLLGWKKNVTHSDFRLGRSKNTQYGGSVLFEILDESPVPFSMREGEGFRSYISEKEGAKTSTYLQVTLTSHLLSRDPNGYPSLQFPTGQLAKVLGIPEGDLSLIKSFARPVRIGSYSSVKLLPGPQWQALEAGSVFIFELKAEGKASFTEKQLREAESNSLGIRTSEGYGRFILSLPGEVSQLEKVEPVTTVAKKPDGNAPREFSALAKAVIVEHWMEQARNAGLTNAEGVSSLKKLGIAQINRLLKIMANATDLKTPRQRVLNLKLPIRQPMERVVLDLGQSGVDLLSHIQRLLEEPSKEGEKAEKQAYLPYRSNDPELKRLMTAIGWNFSQANEDNQKIHFWLVQCYLVSLLTQLSKKRRNMEQDGYDHN